MPATDFDTYVGKVVVITGASSGFGKGTALELAERGANVVLAARSEESLCSIAEECNAHGLFPHEPSLCDKVQEPKSYP